MHRAMQKTHHAMAVAHVIAMVVTAAMDVIAMVHHAMTSKRWTPMPRKSKT